MADVATTSVEPQSSPKGNVKKDKKKSERPKATHPSTAVMVNNAIQNLKERGGSSLQAIKKYISATYKVEGEKFAPFIKKYLKASVASGALVQTKGKGASGSFKLASTAVTKKTPSSSTAKPKKSSTATTSKSATKTKPKATAAKKTAAVKSKKSTAATLEKRKTASSAKVAKPKSPSKAKKTTKAPTKKPKSPKPKTTKAKVGKRKASPKKK